MLYGKCGGVGVCTCAGCLYESQGSHGTRKQMQLGHLAGLFVSSSVVSKPISLVLFVSSSVVSKPIRLSVFARYCVCLYVCVCVRVCVCVCVNVVVC
jgi:hypothetical protein